MAAPKHIHIATVGDHEVMIYKVFNHLSDIDRLYLLYTVADEYETYLEDKDQYCNKAKTIKKELSNLCPDIILKPVRLEDFMGIVQTIYSIARENGTEPRYSINISGGTKLMSAAAYYSAYYIRADVYYSQRIDDKNGDPIPSLTKVIKIDAPKAVNLRGYTKLQKEILKFVEQYESGRIDRSDFVYKNVLSNVDIANHLKTNKQNISNNLKSLVAKGLLEKEVEGRNNSIKLTPHGVMIARYIDTEDVKIINEW